MLFVHFPGFQKQDAADLSDFDDYDDVEYINVPLMRPPPSRDALNAAQKQLNAENKPTNTPANALKSANAPSSIKGQESNIKNVENNKGNEDSIKNSEANMPKQVMKAKNVENSKANNAKIVDKNKANQESQAKAGDNNKATSHVKNGTQRGLADRIKQFESY